MMLAAIYARFSHALNESYLVRFRCAIFPFLLMATAKLSVSYIFAKLGKKKICWLQDHKCAFCLLIGVSAGKVFSQSVKLFI